MVKVLWNLEIKLHKVYGFYFGPKVILVLEGFDLYIRNTVESLVDSTWRTWNSEALQALVDLQDVKFIESIPLSRTQRMDRDG